MSSELGRDKALKLDFVSAVSIKSQIDKYKVTAIMQRPKVIKETHPTHLHHNSFQTISISISLLYVLIHSFFFSLQLTLFPVRLSYLSKQTILFSKPTY